MTIVRPHGFLLAGAIVLLTNIPAGGADSNVHWAFRPLTRVSASEIGPGTRRLHVVDRFVEAEFKKRGLSPAVPATRGQLIRRITFDLLGLPPTPEEIDAFVKDRSPDAWERLIDRLLASPHYGERWGRHWLDLARFAESDGFEHDALRPNSWRYRDYVIQSFNTDKPYDRFVREQIAGDELWPDDPAAVTATALHLLGPDMVDSADQVQRRLNTLNDATDVTASVFLGITMGCARCHDHKFEPITQQDYYSMQAWFAPAAFRRDTPVPTATERAVHESAARDYQLRTASTQARLDALEKPYRDALYGQKLMRLSEDAQIAHRTSSQHRTMEQEGTVRETASMLVSGETELSTSLPDADSALRNMWVAELKRIPKPASLPTTMALQSSNGPVARTFVLGRGDYNNPTVEVHPGVPAVICGGSRTQAAAGRTQLADWIASSSNPLTARVMVNRIWQHHFGRGLVATPSDFGTRGSRPTHPELLDWLAQEFIARGWSVKAMHRLILASATYQQSSVAGRESFTRDPENKWLARQNRIRLEGEAVRDSLLAISGRLNARMGGPSVAPPIASEITRTSKNWTPTAVQTDHMRRSVYILARRNLRFPFLEVFDAPDNNLTCPERGRSTTAPQALTLLNSDEVMDAARATAARLLKEAGSTARRMDRAFRLILGHAPTAKECRLAREFLNESAGRRGDAAGPEQLTAADWAELCRALFNLNAFAYVD